MDINQQALDLHYELQGKIEVISRKPIQTREDLSLMYTPGVAEPCRVIAKDYEQSFRLTRRSNLVAVITDGSAVLGLGDIGPAAGMPVMEGKCALFKEFGGVDAFPICVDTKDVDKLVETIALISKSFGGINLEDIAAPRCFEVERRLKEVCDIPVFHDDQHGTLADALKGADAFVGVSRPNLVTAEMVSTMNQGIVFAMANPTPEIMPDEAKKGGAVVIGTGRSDFPNQINNVLVFPGIFKGALAVRAKEITEGMKIRAAKALAALVTDDQLTAAYILPSALDKTVADAVADAVAQEAREQGIARI